MTTGQLIKAARKKAKMTQAELAKKLGISYVGVSQWENDLRNPKFDTIKRIAAALGVEWTELVPEEQQGETILNHMKRIPPGTEANIDTDDEEFLKLVLPKMSELDTLTDEETALKTLLNSVGYDFIKTKGNYFFTYKSGGSEISAADFDELLSCARNSLKIAAKALELKLLKEAFDHINQHAISAAEKDLPEE